MAYLAGAFAVAWLLTFIYLFTLLRRQRQLEQDVMMLRELLQSRQETDR